MYELIQFLLARIEEQASAARKSVELDKVFGEDFEVTYSWTRHTHYVPNGARGMETAKGAPTPAAVLADCKAKNELISFYYEVNSGVLRASAETWVMLKHLIQTFAQAYSDHSDFKPEWKQQ